MRENYVFIIELISHGAKTRFQQKMLLKIEIKNGPA
jgi:hypothetical protein